MVNCLFEGAPHRHWSQKDYWTLDDVLNISFGGTEHLSFGSYDDLKELEENILCAIAAKELKAENTGQKVIFKRDDIVKWASKNISEFPFEPKDFPPVISKKHPGSSREDAQLRMIGALSLLLMQSHKIYKKGEVPNQSRIVNETLKLFEHLQKEDPNLQGLGNSNFREAIRKGLELIISSK